MWIDLTKEQKVQVLEQTGIAKGLPAFVIEKDWWVCILLKAMFQSQYKDPMILEFQGLQKGEAYKCFC